ncbi:hypothetical protein TEA_021216 [Camellia sinensis var. sinensis]|uniref:non-specific serine/threonine protein kinase n=1 Tax=Camellia sinensis var. sinensis TaxID=542762 RepID=A0A4S4EZF0_CAMSN|nr:hypothetical protein TEA_021216 [Camellia sinensis var. sinensis]
MHPTRAKRGWEIQSNGNISSSQERAVQWVSPLATLGHHLKDVGTREGQVEQVVVNVRKDNSCSAEEDSMLKKLPRVVNDDSRVVSGGPPLLTPGFVKSLSGSEGSRPGINIEVVLEGAQVGGPVDGLSCALINKVVPQTQNGLAQSREHTRCLSQAQELVRFNTTSVGREPVVTANTHRLQEGKKGGSRGRGKRGVHRNVASFSGGFQRGALLRAAAAVLSHSQSQNSRSSRRRKLAIEEAHATLQLGKRLGMNCEGKENEVVQKIVELELQDAERFDKIAKGGQGFAAGLYVLLGVCAWYVALCVVCFMPDGIRCCVLPCCVSPSMNQEVCCWDVAGRYVAGMLLADLLLGLVLSALLSLLIGCVGGNFQLHYANESFFGTLDVTGNIWKYNAKNVSDDELGWFISVVNDMLHKLSRLAAFNPSYGMYAIGVVNFKDTKTIYALVQCTIDLSSDDCNTCLETAIANISTCCCKSRGARLFSRSCFLRYEFYAFYEDESTNSTENQRKFASVNKLSINIRMYWMIVGLAIESAIVVALLGFCVYCLAIRNQTKTKEKQVYGQEVQLHEIGDPNKIDVHHHNLQARDNLNSQIFPFIDLVTLSAATDDFSASNKLGQGGFGPVYKQDLDEFTNEVLLILKLQHKNLVRLLGFCIDGEEKLLIYEYMPNGSLDVFLFDPRKRAQMNWSRRLNMINGIIREMLYLHDDSRLRIIQRDLKPSNVLLDSELNPKILDFGMARIFGGSDVVTNTAKIVGTQ